MALVSSVRISPGVTLWPGWLNRPTQEALLAEVAARIEHAPLYRPRMPRSGKLFSVEETNFGSHGWFSDESGYRYQATHPFSKLPWPDIPDSLVRLWHAVGNYRAPPQCCLANLYRNGARMGLHQDRDEEALDAPVVSVSLGDSAIFRIGGISRRDRTISLTLHSGDVIVFGGASRLAYHGIDRVIADTSPLMTGPLLAGGGRINLTLRRVTAPSEK